jgi:hypothetical protein
MAEGTSTEERLAALGRWELAPDSAEKRRALVKALRGANNVMAARAADMAGRGGMAELAGELAAAFARCMEQPLKRDKGCLAKNAVIDALTALEHDDTDLFLRGIRHVQMEPSWGPPVDTAGYLRGKCAFALAQSGYPDTAFEVAALLFDRETQPRRAAIQTLVYLASEGVELLLRAKAVAGDEEPSIWAECLSALLQLNAERHLPFVAGYLTHGDAAVAEGAALALGETRLPEAFAVLKAHWEESIDPAFKERLLLPMALLRRDEAFAFLLDAVAQSHRNTAAAAVRAMALYVGDPDRRERIRRAVDARDERNVSEAFRESMERT